jgi:hypothetical protein
MPINSLKGGIRMIKVCFSWRRLLNHSICAKSNRSGIDVFNEFRQYFPLNNLPDYPIDPMLELAIDDRIRTFLWYFDPERITKAYPS